MQTFFTFLFSDNRFLDWENTSVKTWGKSLPTGISTGSVAGNYLQKRQEHSENAKHTRLSDFLSSHYKRLTCFLFFSILFVHSKEATLIKKLNRKWPGLLVILTLHLSL